MPKTPIVESLMHELFESFILDEAFDRPLRWKGYEFAKYNFRYEFAKPKTVFEWEMDIVPDFNYGADSKEKLAQHKPVDEYTAFFRLTYDSLKAIRDQRQGSFVTPYGILGGTEAELEVMATVMGILKEFVQQHHPKRLRFTAEEPSRRRLYTRMLQRFVPRLLPGYEWSSQLEKGKPNMHGDQYVYFIYPKGEGSVHPYDANDELPDDQPHPSQEWGEWEPEKEYDDEYMAEALNSQPYPIITPLAQSNGSGDWLATFGTPTHEQWSVLFIRISHDNSKYLLMFKATTSYLQKMNKSHLQGTDIIGGQNAPKVFVTLMHIIKEFVRKAQPDRIDFSADGISRIRVYDRLLKHYAPLVAGEGYSLEHFDDDYGSKEKAYYSLVRDKTTLDEALNSQPYSHTRIMNTSRDRKVSYFNTGKMDYIVMFRHHPSVSYDDRIEVTFRPVKELYHSNPYGIIGGQNASKVFVTVMKIIQEYVQQYRPDVLTFSSDDDNEKRTRTHLYERLLKTYLPILLPDYRLDISIDWDTVVFNIIRRDAQQDSLDESLNSQPYVHTPFVLDSHLNTLATAGAFGAELQHSLHWKTTFGESPVEYEVGFHASPHRPDEPIDTRRPLAKVGIEFQPSDAYKQYLIKTFPDKYGAISSDDLSWGTIGGQNVPKVFVTVIDIIQEFVEKYQPAELDFSAKGKSRIGAYETLVSKYLSRIRHYKVLPSNTVTDPDTGQPMKLFKLVRTTPAQPIREAIGETIVESLLDTLVFDVPTIERLQAIREEKQKDL